MKQIDQMNTLQEVDNIILFFEQVGIVDMVVTIIMQVKVITKVSKDTVVMVIKDTVVMEVMTRTTMDKVDGEDMMVMEVTVDMVSTRQFLNGCIYIA